MSEPVKPLMGPAEVQAILPHRLPILLIDEVLELTENAITARTVLAENRPVFNGHFPGQPLMPGVLLVETMAQAGALLVGHDGDLAKRGKLMAFAAVEQARFRAPVLPGHVLHIFVNLLKARRGIYKFEGHIEVGGRTVAECAFTASEMDQF